LKNLGYFNTNRKKGNAYLDVIIVIILLVVVAIAGVFVKYVFSDINTDFQADPELSQEAKDLIQGQETQYPSTIDFIVLFATIFFWIGGIIASYMVDSHPIFMPIAFIFLLFVWMASIYISNFYQELLITDPEFSATASLFPITNYIMENLLVICILMGCSFLVALYAKSRTGGEF